MSIYADIKKRYKEFTLETSFRNDEGTLGILGASGSGKSLTLKCIAGLITPDEGLIKVGEKTVFDSAAKINLPAQQRNVGYLFQNYALFPHMTVWNNIAIAIKDKSADKDAIIKSLLERYELTGMEQRYPAHLSGGQQQRVALARIFAYEPEILLLDEPFSALDTFLREAMQAELINIISEYKGDVVLVTHSRDEAYRICDKLLIMDEGQIIAHDTTEGVFSAPTNVASARITGVKNISKIEKITNRKFLATDWNLALESGEDIGDAITHIGIRAHYFSAKPASDPAESNRLEIEIEKVIEGAFDQNVILRKKGEKSTHSRVWWICNKDEDLTDLHTLYINKSDIILLES